MCKDFFSPKIRKEFGDNFKQRSSISTKPTLRSLGILHCFYINTVQTGLQTVMFSPKNINMFFCYCLIIETLIRFFNIFSHLNFNPIVQFGYLWMNVFLKFYSFVKSLTHYLLQELLMKAISWKPKLAISAQFLFWITTLIRKHFFYFFLIRSPNFDSHSLSGYYNTCSYPRRISTDNIFQFIRSL